MNKTKQKRLESKGWRIGTASDFLNLSPEEAVKIELMECVLHALRFELHHRKD